MHHIEYFKTFLKDVVDLDDTRLNKLKSRVDAVYRALKSDPVVGPLINGRSPQGSWAQRTIIKPKPDGEYDAD
nr:nucleotidyltransferase [Acidimicrobiia bacterium]